MTSYKLLGRMCIGRLDGPMTPSAPKQRQVLAMLLLNADRVVPIDRLVEELWEDRPPPSARPTLQTYVYQLRRALGLGSRPGGGLAQTHLRTWQTGYQLQFGAHDTLDVIDFQAGLQRGRAEMADGRVAEAAETLRRALDLWRNAALVDVAVGPLLSVEAARLGEARMSALALRFEADLELGRHEQLVSELTALATANPTHEGHAAMLMKALHRCGRRDQALEVYRRMRTELVNRLGVEPGGATQRLHQAILADDPSLAAPPETVPASLLLAREVPAQLPADVPDFVGRQQELDRLRGLTADPRGGAPRIIAVTGRAGIGKTVFVLHAAHQLRSSYPDGQFYVDLREVNAGTRSLGDVLAGFLRAVGIRSPLRGYSAAELGCMFRTWAADRRVLLVVDDVVSAAQLRELLPSGPGSAVLIAGRLHLEGLPGLHTFELPPLPPSECMTLLGTLIGPDRVAAELPAATELAALCDHLPLTVAAAGTRLTARPTWSVARLVRRLRGEEDRLRELSHGGLALVSSTETSYRLLADTHQRAFRVIAATPGAMRPRMAARLLGLGESAAEAILDRLVSAHLVEEHRGPAHSQSEPEDECASYRVPSLIRLAVRALTSAPAPGAMAADGLAG